jgi:hypothetical protein
MGGLDLGKRLGKLREAMVFDNLEMETVNELKAHLGRARTSIPSSWGYLGVRLKRQDYYEQEQTRICSCVSKAR